MEVGRRERGSSSGARIGLAGGLKNGLASGLWVFFCLFNSLTEVDICKTSASVNILIVAGNATASVESSVTVTFDSRRL